MPDDRGGELTRDRIRERVAAFDTWHYEFDLGGVRTPVRGAELVNRHRQRYAYFFAPLVARCGGSLAGRRVLDLGCNAGFWSLCAIEAGCAQVVGVDARATHIEQAELVFEAKRVPRERYAFRQDDVYAIEPGTFDVVLCLGLLYHVADPVGLFERLRRWTGELLVLDTSLALDDRPVFELRTEAEEDPRNSARGELVLRPSLAAVMRLARAVGFAAQPLEPTFASYAGARDYADGRRRALFCAPDQKR